MSANSPGGSARSTPLDGLRALAALSVVGFHAWLYRIDEPPGERSAFFDKLFFELSIGLICFFVLSGFLLYRSFARAALTGGKPVDLGRYAARRAARILPAYYASVVGCLLLFGLVGFSNITPSAGQLPLFALFAQNYSADTVMQINPVTWTLCVEVSFYALLPLLGFAALRLGPRRTGLHVAMLAALVGMTVAANLLLGATEGGRLVSKMLPAYIGFFALGMLAAMWTEWRPLRRGRDSLRPLPTAALMAAGFALVALHAYRRETAGSFTWAWSAFGNLPAGVGFALVIAAAAVGTGPALRWLSARPIAYLGVISYGIYLWHLPLLLAVREVGLLPAALLPRLGVVLVLSIGAAALSWSLLERPILGYVGSRHRASRARRERRRARAALAEA